MNQTGLCDQRERRVGAAFLKLAPVILVATCLRGVDQRDQRAARIVAPVQLADGAIDLVAPAGADSLAVSLPDDPVDAGILLPERTSAVAVPGLPDEGEPIENASGVQAKAEPFRIWSMEIPIPQRAVKAPSTGATERNWTIPNDLIDKSKHAGPVRTAVAAPSAASVQADKALAERAASLGANRAGTLAHRVETALGPQESPSRSRILAAVPRTPPLVVREFAAPPPAAGNPTADDSILWQPVIVLPTDGKTTLHFHLGAAPGGYQVIVAGHTLDGRIGSVRTILPIAKDAPAPRK